MRRPFSWRRAIPQRPLLNLQLLEGREQPAIFTPTVFDDFPITSIDPATGKLSAFGDAITLRSAIQAANQTPGTDTVNLASGTYVLTQVGANEDINQVGDLDVLDSLILTGNPVNGPVMLDGNNTDRVFDLGSGITVQIDNVTIQNGFATVTDSFGETGGGIRSSSQLTLNNVVVQNNQIVGTFSTDSNRGLDAQGGGIAFSGSLIGTNLIVTQNLAIGGPGGTFSFAPSNGGSALGGGILALGSLELRNSQITSNTATGGNAFDAAGPSSFTAAAGRSLGGGIFVNDFNVFLLNTHVSGNVAQGGSGISGVGNGALGGDADGGGLSIQGMFGLTTLTIVQSTFDGNIAQGGDGVGGSSVAPGSAVGGFAQGGAISMAQNVLSVSNSTISGNTASGGQSDDTATFDSGSAFGGGIFSANFSSPTFIGNSTIVQNSVFAGDGPNIPFAAGGGLYFQNDGGNDVIVSSIIAANFAADFGDLTSDQLPFQSGGNNLIGAVELGEGFVDGVNADQVGSIAAPIDPAIDFLTDNGGLTPTHGLLPGSPAIDAGSNTQNLTSDQRGDPITRVVTQADIGALEVQLSATTIIAFPPTAAPGEPLSFTIAVAPATGVGLPPQGTVNLFIDGVFFDIGFLDPSGLATVDVPAGLPSGTYSITATYDQSSIYFGSVSPPVSVAVTAAATSTTVAVSPLSPTQPTANQPITFFAQVSSSNPNTDFTGQLEFRVDGTLVATVPVDSSGLASFTLSGGLLPVLHTLEGTYLGNSQLQSSVSPTITFEVQRTASTTTIIATPNPVDENNPLTFTIFVNSQSPAPPPTGGVLLRINGVAQEFVSLQPSGQATITRPNGLPAGTYTITADYVGDGSTLPSSSAPVTLTVNAVSVQSPTSTTVTPTPNPTTPGTSISFPVTVSSTGPVSGVVTIFANGNAIGSTTISGNTATVVLPNGLGAGTFSITANYSGDANNLSSVSNPVTLVVSATPTPPAPTATTISIAPNPVLATDPLNILITVNGSTPSGTVTLFVNGSPFGTANLNAQGQATITLPLGLDAGAVNVSVNYSGDGLNAASSSPITVLQVSPVATSTFLASTPNPASLGQTVFLTATVTANPTSVGALRVLPSGTAALSATLTNGTVQFFNGTTPIGSSRTTGGVATLAVDSLPPGVNALSAVFTPDSSNALGSVATLSQTINVVREIFAVGAGAGLPGLVQVYDANGTLLTSFFPFEQNFHCGIVVATADVNGDGIEDVIAGSGFGGGPHVRIFNGANFTLINEFFAFDIDFRGGVNLAAGDLDGDGRAEIVVGAGPSGGPRVRGFQLNGTQVVPTFDFFAYPAELRGGVSVSVLDGLLVTGAGFGGGPHVRVFSGAAATPVASYFAFDPASRDGVNVALGRIGQTTVVYVANGAGLPLSRTLDALTGTPLNTQSIFETTFSGGVGVTTVTAPDGQLRTVFGAGFGGGPRVRIFNPDGSQVNDFFAFDPDSRSGVFVG